MILLLRDIMEPYEKRKKCKMLSEGVRVVVLMKLKLYINDHVMVLKKLSLLC